MKRLLASVAAIGLLLSASLAYAAPLPYPTAPMDTVQAAANAVVTTINTNLAPAQTLNVCSGGTPVTCQGLRINLSITGLTTAASTLSAAQTITDASVVATSQITCSGAGSSTGAPVIVNVTPAAGSFTLQVQNTATAAALTSPLTTNCIIFN